MVDKPCNTAVTFGINDQIVGELEKVLWIVAAIFLQPLVCIFLCDDFAPVLADKLSGLYFCGTTDANMTILKSKFLYICCSSTMNRSILAFV
jgi:hypothetical protein